LAKPKAFFLPENDFFFQKGFRLENNPYLCSRKNHFLIIFIYNFLQPFTIIENGRE